MTHPATISLININIHLHSHVRIHFIIPSGLVVSLFPRFVFLESPNPHVPILPATDQQPFPGLRSAPVHAQHDIPVALAPPQHLFTAHGPDDDLPVLTAAAHERFFLCAPPVTRRRRAVPVSAHHPAQTVPGVDVALVGLDARPFAVPPQPHAIVERPGQQEPTVGGEPHARHALPVLVDERLEALSRARVPDPDQPVGAATAHHGPVPEKVDPPHRVRMGRQPPHDPPGAHVPQEHGLVVAPAHQHVPLGAEGQAVHVVAVPEQGRGRDGGIRAQRRPQEDALVVARRGEGVVRADGRPGDRVHPGEVGTQRPQVSERGVGGGVRRDRVDVDRVVGGGGGQERHVGRELDGGYPSGVCPFNGQKG